MMTKLIKKAGLVASGAMLLLPVVASANMVVDGSFEDPSVSGTFTTINAGSSIGAWTVTAGSVDLINNYWQPAQGSQSVDVAGNINGTIQQTISGITDGQTYLLTFYMAGNPDGDPTTKTLQASMGDFSQSFTFNDTGYTKDNMGWTEESATFVATGDVLSFQDLSLINGGPSPYGAALDNVSLEAVPAPIPEPSTVVAGAMMLLPFGVGAFRSLRKERKV